MQTLLLDDAGHEVGPGQIGEIAVRSRYLPLGYWRRPDLTRSKFLPDPFGGDERTYLTGDLGRLLPDGSLVHLGRKDFMVKIRGFRVELGEIEKHILDHVAVKEAAVVAREDRSGEKRLNAYVILKGNAMASASDLGKFLREKIPDYALPSAFVFLEALPLTPNGKVDRQLLPDPDNIGQDSTVRISPHRIPCRKSSCTSGKTYWTFDLSVLTTISLSWADTRYSP